MFTSQSLLMTGPKKAPLLPLSLHHNSASDQAPPSAPAGKAGANKENAVPVVQPLGGCGVVAANPCRWKKLEVDHGSKCHRSKPVVLALATNKKPSSLCVKFKEESARTLPWEPIPFSSEVWEFSDSEAAPASTWATLPNRSLLYRPLPLDVGKCSCTIVKERANGKSGEVLYSLYTSEGQGRQDRKLAVARHSRRNARSEFIVAQNVKGIFSSSDESLLGSITANFMGSKYQIWDQRRALDSLKNPSGGLLTVVAYKPTISTIMGCYRSIQAWIPKQKSMQLKNSNNSQIQHINSLAKDWDSKPNRADRLVSKVPYYNPFTKRHELDFRLRAGRVGQRIQTSVKNFQLTMEEKGKQTILQLGKIGRSKYVMEYRHPLTGYQAFCICLTSIDSKLCCSV